MATPIIIPAILTDDPNDFQQQMAKYAVFVKRIQVDVSDGTLVASRTVPETTIVIPPGVSIDLHMMVADPTSHMDALIKLHPSMVIFHAEIQQNLLPFYDRLKQAGIKTGVAFQKQTYPGSYKVYIDAVDHVLIFASELGKQGAAADIMQVEKARIIRGMRRDVEIGWDGGATVANVRTIFQGGITAINVGNVLKTAVDPMETYKTLIVEAEKLGVM